MDASYIVTVYVVLDDLYQTFGQPAKYRPRLQPPEVVLVAVVAAKYFQNHLERALVLLIQTGYIPAISVSRFNRQLHRHAELLELGLELLMELARAGELFILDSEPLPVCKRKRARRCRKVRGAIYCGYCAAKDEKYFGWKLHLLCTPEGIPVNFTVLPAALHDLTPLYELTDGLPPDSRVLGDKGYNSANDEAWLAADGVRLVPIRKRNLNKQHDWADEYDLRTNRRTIETLNSQSESMGLQRLRARTRAGFDLKVHASLVALYFTRSLADED
jgi:IS5 family transposase